MEGYTIEVTKRENKGKGASNRYRKQGLIPAEIYQKGVANASGLVVFNSFVHLAEKSKISQVFLLKSEESSINDRPVLVREIQRDYLTGKPIHIDFQALSEDEEIEVEVGLTFVGEPFGVKQEGGIMTAAAHQILVSSFPRDIPSELVVNVADLRLNQGLHAGQIELPSGVRLITHPDEPIVSVTAPKAEVAAAAAAVGAEGAEAAAGTPAPAAAGAKPGEKPAAGGKAEKGSEKK